MLKRIGNQERFTRMIPKNVYCVNQLLEDFLLFRSYMLFTRREVRIGKNCARGLGYRGCRPRAVHKTEGTVSSQYGPTLAGE